MLTIYHLKIKLFEKISESSIKLWKTTRKLSSSGRNQIVIEI